jgi:hypothetical protein
MWRAERKPAVSGETANGRGGDEPIGRLFRLGALKRFLPGLSLRGPGMAIRPVASAPIRN